MLQRRALLAATMLVGLATPALAEWPEGAVNYIIPFDAGGESDVTARFQQPYFESMTGQSLIIQYQPGAGGAQAWSQLNSAPSDGSTVMGTNLPHIIMQPLAGDAGYETDDLVTVYWFHYTPDAILVPMDSQFETLGDLIAYAAENPGVTTFSGSGTNSANDIAHTRFDELAGITTTYIPFGGTSPSVAAVTGSQVTAAWGYSTVGMQQADNLRMLAVATEERLAAFPDVPTFKELGFDLVSGAYRGVALPKDSSEELRQEVSDVVGAINADPEFQQQMEDAGFVVTFIPYDAADAFMAEQREQLSGIAETMAQQ